MPLHSTPKHRTFTFADPWRQHQRPTKNGKGRPKLPWKTAEEARAHALSHTPPLNVYQCDICGDYHVGLRRNPYQWMAEAIVSELELGKRTAVYLYRENHTGRGTVFKEYARTLRRKRGQGRRPK